MTWFRAWPFWALPGLQTILERLPEMAGSTLRLEMLEYEAYIPMALQLQSTTVGTAGVYLQRGGHSYLTPSDDLAVDNHLEARVVTSDVLLHQTNQI